jgi:hypothetical protein
LCAFATSRSRQSSELSEFMGKRIKHSKLIRYSVFLTKTHNFFIFIFIGFWACP